MAFGMLAAMAVGGSYLLYQRKQRAVWDTCVARVKAIRTVSGVEISELPNDKTTAVFKFQVSQNGNGKVMGLGFNSFGGAGMVFFSFKWHDRWWFGRVTPNTCGLEKASGPLPTPVEILSIWNEENDWESTTETVFEGRPAYCFVVGDAHPSDLYPNLKVEYFFDKSTHLPLGSRLSDTIGTSTELLRKLVINQALSAASSRRVIYDEAWKWVRDAKRAGPWRYGSSPSDYVPSGG